MNTLDSITVSVHAKSKEKGFTLIEVLIAIVVVGILSAVVIIGIGALTNKGSSSACQASADAAKAAATVHYANSNPTAYPASLYAMTITSPKELEFPATVSVPVNGNATTGASWTLTMTPGSPPTFACTVP